MPVNWCAECNGRGAVGWLWWKKVCPTCKAATEKIHGGYLHPMGPRPTPSPAPPPTTEQQIRRETLRILRNTQQIKAGILPKD